MFGVSNVGIIPRKAVVNTYRYWRIVTTRTRSPDSSAVNISEVAFSNTSGGSQISFSSSFSSSEAPTDPASNAFDNSSSTFWSSLSGEALPQVIGVVFATPVSITYLKLQAAFTATRASRAPRLFRVEASSDGSTYTTIYSSADQVAWASLEVRNFYIGV